MMRGKGKHDLYIRIMRHRCRVALLDKVDAFHVSGSDAGIEGRVLEFLPV